MLPSRELLLQWDKIADHGSIDLFLNATMHIQVQSDTTLEAVFNTATRPWADKSKG